MQIGHSLHPITEPSKHIKILSYSILSTIKASTLDTYQLRHMTTSCWFGWRGRDARASACGKRLYHSSWPSTCWHRYVQPLKLLTTAVHIHQTQDGHTEESRLPWPSFFQDRKYGSWDLQRMAEDFVTS